MRRRNIPFFFLIVGLLVALGTVPALAQVTELTVWFGRQDFIPGDAFDKFHAENPDIRVTADVIPLEEAYASFVRSYRAGNAPDIVQILTFSKVALSEQGMLLDVSSILEAWEQENPDHYYDMAPAAWEIASHNEVPHGMALHVAPYWYVYRNDLFEEAGIPEPKTWDDAIEAGRQLRGPNMLGFTQIGFAGHIDWFISYFMYMGGEFVDNVMQLDSDAGYYLLEFYQTMMRDNIAHPDTVAWDSGEMRAAFMSGEAAQFFDGANVFATVQQNLEYGVEWLALPGLVRPGGEDGWVMPGNSWPYVVSSTAAGKEEAIGKVLQYLSETDIVKEVAMRYQPATRMAVFEDPEYLVYQPWFAELAEYYAMQVPIPVHARQPEINRILGEAMQDALTRPDADPVEMAKYWQEEINAVANQ